MTIRTTFRGYGPHPPPYIRQALTEAGDRLAAADREHQAAIRDIAAWLRAGQTELTMTEMAMLAGITRRTAYKLLAAADE